MFERLSACVLALLCLLGATPSGTQPGDTAPPGPAPAAFSQTQRAAILAGAEKAVGDYTFAGKVPSVSGVKTPVRDYDGDGATDDVDADPSDPSVK